MECPNCEYSDVRSFDGSLRGRLLTYPCVQHSGVAYGITAKEAAQRLRDVFATRTDALMNTSVMLGASRQRHTTLRCAPRRRPWLAWFQPRRLYFRDCDAVWSGRNDHCSRRWCWDCGQWRKVLQPDEIAELERDIARFHDC